MKRIYLVRTSTCVGGRASPPTSCIDIALVSQLGRLCQSGLLEGPAALGVAITHGAAIARLNHLLN